jgi:hypothetical protein
MSSRARRFLVALAVAGICSLVPAGVASAAIPTVPTGLTAATTADASGSVTLTWTASSNVPTDYVIEYSSDAFASSYSRFIDTVSTATTATVAGLVNGTTYTFRVKGFNGDGTSAASTTASAIPVSGHNPSDLAVYGACPAAVITSTAFTDTNSADVACINYYGITQGTTATTFSPIESVSRWQMALFLTRMVVPAGGTLPSGADQGFTDILGKSAEIQTAVNQLKQLGITVGTTATTYSPDQFVTREEMALFIERLLKAVQTGPGGNEEFVTGTSGDKEIKSLNTDHNFTDLASVSLISMQNAIVNLWNLGVTESSSATEYQPTVDMNRLNMAQMMARALDHTNARPSGTNIQSNAYQSAGSAAVTISVTQRTTGFLPVASAQVDTFRYLATTDVTSQVFATDGSCAQTVVTEVSVTGCYIDGTEQTTDVKGNLALFNTAIVAGQIWDYYAWSAAIGTSFDNDIHAVDVSKITING